jgi:hypothetical protein
VSPAKPFPRDFSHSIAEFHGQPHLLLAAKPRKYFILPFLCFRRRSDYGAFTKAFSREFKQF